ncbi:DNA adenine methylase [Neobacillus sp. NPDC093182]|uniref:DNA adenine methylase n=1 Tax=Neobacillus sp. NPDC093182 TaxID=3364297 RepID=UPI0038005C9B
MILKNKNQISHSQNDEKRAFFIQNRRYLGAKTKLLPLIEDVINDSLQEWNSFTDLFAGTGVVGNRFNKPGKELMINDLLYSNIHSYHTFFSPEPFDTDKVASILQTYNECDVKEDNYFSINYGGKYFTVENARKAGYVREHMEELKQKGKVNSREFSILFTSLMYALDRAANTVGHYEAYRKNLDMFNPITLLMPALAENGTNQLNKIYQRDANELVREISTDILYIDTPYNSRQYVDSYHLLENLAMWGKPELEGVARKISSENRQYGKSKYCLKSAPEAFDDLIQHANAKLIVVSYSNMAEKGDGRSNAKISDSEMISALEQRGKTISYEQDYKHFTTGLKDIENYQERLFVCHVGQ